MSVYLPGPKPGAGGKAASLAANERPPKPASPPPKATPQPASQVSGQQVSARKPSKQGSQRFYSPPPGRSRSKPDGYETVATKPARLNTAPGSFDRAPKPLATTVKKIPYWTVSRGKGGDQALAGFTPGQRQTVAALHAENTPVARAALDAAVHPLTDLSQQALGVKPPSLRGIGSDVGNLVVSLAPPDAVGAAGLFGLRGLRALKGAKVVEDAAQAAKAIDALKPPAVAMTNLERFTQLKNAGVPKGEAESLMHSENAVRSFQRRVQEASNPQAKEFQRKALAGQKMLLHKAQKNARDAMTSATPRVAKAANATEAAYRLAQIHKIPIEDVAGTGKNARVTVGDVSAHHFKLLDPAAQVREGLKGARSQYGVEKAARKVEQSERVKAAAEALATTKNPHEALIASSAPLRGEYAQIDYKGLKELNPETLDQLMVDAQHHPALGFHQKRTVMKALKAAVEDGRVPRPHEQRLIEMVFGRKTAAGMMQQASQNAFDKAINVLNIPRALQTTLDVSGLMRQNLVAMVSHPVLGSRTLPVAFKAMTADGFEAAQKAVRENPWYASAVQNGVQFTDIGEHSSMLAHEEGFQSDIAANALDKIPKVPNVIKGSARSYVATGNTMKMAAYENRMRIAQAAGDPSIYDEKTLKQIAQVINAATGRGTLPGRAEHLLPAMNTFLFSPRLMLARLHYLDPTWYFRLDGPARREALRGLFALAGSVTGALYLFSRIPGVHVDWQHPQSADWGKLRMGNTRIDIAGGFQQYVRLASELATQKTVSSTTGATTRLGSGYGKPTGWDVVTQFGVNKLAPAPGFAVNVLRGHDAVGNKFYWGTGATWKKVAENYLTPLTFQDAKDIYNEKHGGLNGIEWALGGYGLGSLGLGLQTYNPKPVKGGSASPLDTGSASGSSYLPSSSSGGGSVYLP